MYPLAYFGLKPANSRAEDVVTSVVNAQFWGTGTNKHHALLIGKIKSKDGNGCLVTIGREGDIVVDDRTLSRIHCSFDIDLNTGFVFLRDRSSQRSTQVFGPDATPFQPNLHRKLVVQSDINTLFGFGGRDGSRYQFNIEWYVKTEGKGREQDTLTRRNIPENPNHALTVSYVIPNAPTGETGAPHTLQLPQRKIWWGRMKHLGSGSFGSVWKGVDAHSAKLMAVKLLKRPASMDDEKWAKKLQSAKREVAVLSIIQHPHIVEFLGYQGWDLGAPQIFMALKDGSLYSLLYQQPTIAHKDLSLMVLHQMLQAIDYLAVKNVVHQDIKPENILYTTASARYHFQLCDFGLSQVVDCDTGSCTYVGCTKLYMSPEIVSGIATHKSDVWSLYVTILYILDQQFRKFYYEEDVKYSIILDYIIVNLETGPLHDIPEMVRIDPDERASAAEMLLKCFQGLGLSTTRDQIEPLYDTITSDEEDTDLENATLARSCADAPGSTVITTSNEAVNREADSQELSCEVIPETIIWKHGGASSSSPQRQLQEPTVTSGELEQTVVADAETEHEHVQEPGPGLQEQGWTVIPNTVVFSTVVPQAAIPRARRVDRVVKKPAPAIRRRALARMIDNGTRHATLSEHNDATTTTLPEHQSTKQTTVSVHQDTERTISSEQLIKEWYALSEENRRNEAARQAVTSQQQR